MTADIKTLKAQADAANAALASALAASRAENAKAARAFCDEHGLTAEDVFGSRKPKQATAGRKVAVKYRSPLNPSLTWTGRGFKPVWLREALANGASLESFLCHS